MKSVFIIVRSVPYEGDDIVAIFSTEKKAEKFMEGLDTSRFRVTYNIDEWELNVKGG